MKQQGTRPLSMGHHKRKPIYVLIVSSLACWQNETQALQAGLTPPQKPLAIPDRLEFDSRFLHGGQAVDLSRFARGNVVQPGPYSTDIYVNGNWMGRREVQFKAMAGKTDAQPCFAKDLIAASGVDMAALPEAALARLADGGACTQIGDIVAGASSHFDFDSLRLDLAIPQMAMRRQARGYVSPDQWDAGVPMGLLGYNLNTYHSRNGNGSNSTQGYLGINGGFNLDRWHLRHNGSFSWNDQGGKSYQNIATYVQRDLPDWSSQMVIGDSYTGGDLLDSVSFRGLRLHSDDRMLPESQRGFAPVVRGVANSNARVTIMQNGMKLYETTVAPGPFVIDDLYPTGYGGDLQVSITEADGSVRRFAVPYAAVPLSLREGKHRYSLTGGVVRHLPNSSPFMAQATWQYGFTNALTGYGGASIAKGYFAPMIGLVFNTEWGAFGTDLTHATTRIPGEKSYSGQSLRASYAKSFAATGTNVSLAAYRYSTNGFFSLNDALRAQDQALVNAPSLSLSRPRNRASLNLSQQFGTGGGYLSFVAATTRYWNGQGASNDYTIGYGNSLRNLSYNLSATRQRDANGLSSTLLYAGLSIPLGGNERPATLSSNLSRDSQGRSRAMASLSGSLGENNDLYYGLSGNYESTTNGPYSAAGTRVDASANASYRSRYAELSSSVSAGSGYRQFSAGARGAVVAHPGGVTLSQPVGETFAIVQAKDAEGASIGNASGVKIDSRGYAVVPNLTPYAMNEVSIDPKGLSTDVELHETSQRVAPVAGAVPLLVFKTSYSRSAVINATQPDGTPIPFGATVSDDKGQDLAIVGQAGKLLARGLADQGRLQVKWETPDGQASCDLAYALPDRQRGADTSSMTSLHLPCTGNIQYAKAKPQRQPTAAVATPTLAALTAPALVTAPATAPVEERTRLLAGLKLSTTVRVLVPEQSAGPAGKPRPPVADAQRQSPQAEGKRDLKIERTLAALGKDRVADAATVAATLGSRS
ncbi:Heat shock protein E [Delftia tsuruhatensis]|uniref:fimbria/pilus outer membrane usher protein n=1 Tax=Delftia tsuruhatensis TaxID=180282 RepID=UPI001E73F590|nr:fimbria/pilus outer membrane usher protein [Delftia tsuruhatensis]CAB5715479.1 Heat shock protein E [Delftia tsuruhatensis]CAC9676734.1 Heat shock protein E [Delftia tsuruhatensis]